MHQKNISLTETYILSTRPISTLFYSNGKSSTCGTAIDSWSNWDTLLRHVLWDDNISNWFFMFQKDTRRFIALALAMRSRASGEYTHTSFSAEVHLKAGSGRLPVGYRGNLIPPSFSNTQRGWGTVCWIVRVLLILLCVYFSVCGRLCVLGTCNLGGTKEGRERYSFAHYCSITYDANARNILHHFYFSVLFFWCWCFYCLGCPQLACWM